MADAMERIESLEGLLEKHVDKFDAHVDKQQLFNENITARIVEAEKADITIVGLLTTIKDRLDKRTIGWQIWLPFSATAILTAIGLIAQLWPKGATP